MNLLFNGLFWGAIVILIGVTIILNGVLGTKIPIVRIVFGLLLIYWGVSLLAGVRFRHSGAAVFSDAEVKATSAGHQDVIFGRATVDLSAIVLKEGVNRYEVNTVFGASVIKLDPAMPVKVVASSAFAGVKMPDGANIAFGETTYRSPNLKEDSTYLLVKTAVVFGGTEVVSR
jgi:hypothetical protein